MPAWLAGGRVTQPGDFVRDGRSMPPALTDCTARPDLGLLSCFSSCCWCCSTSSCSVANGPNIRPHNSKGTSKIVTLKTSNFHRLWHWYGLKIQSHFNKTRQNMLFLLRGRIFFSAAEFFGLWGRTILKRVGNTGLLVILVEWWLQNT